MNHQGSIVCSMLPDILKVGWWLLDFRLEYPEGLYSSGRGVKGLWTEFRGLRNSLVACLCSLSCSSMFVHSPCPLPLMNCWILYVVQVRCPPDVSGGNRIMVLVPRQQQHRQQQSRNAQVFTMRRLFRDPLLWGSTVNYPCMALVIDSVRCNWECRRSWFRNNLSMLYSNNFLGNRVLMRAWGATASAASAVGRGQSQTARHSGGYPYPTSK